MTTTTSSLQRRRWDVAPLATAEVVRALRDYPPIMAQLLFNRGVRSVADAEAFLHPPASSPDDASRIPGAQAAVERIMRALRNRELIAVYGDFDADGVTSAALLTEWLHSAGARLVPYIPDRVSEGHGLNLGAVQELHSRGVKLIVTADCGITNHPEVAAAADLGIDVVITDHHTPPASLPMASAVVDPKLPGSPPAYAGLASVGVAFTLCEALARELSVDLDPALLEFVALGTIADMAPMTGLNRSLVREGLARLNKSQRPGIRALLQAARLELGHVDTESVAFALGPRINAPGRIDHASPAYLLLTAPEMEEAQRLAEQIDAANGERQRTTADVLAKVRDYLAQLEAMPPILILGDELFPAGIVGLAAGKLTEQCYRPSIVYQRGDRECRASCRSIPEFNIIEALRECDGKGPVRGEPVEPLFVRYGGHAQAAGFTIATERLPELERRLLAIAERKLAGQPLVPRIAIDAEIPLGRINGPLIKAMRDLAPFGLGNPTPIFLARDVEVRDMKAVGADGKHLRITLRDGAVAWTAMAFNAPPLEGSTPKRIDVVFNLSVDRFNGRETLRLNVVDFRRA
ncbi:MAG: single-stranded-DNA-specific exonuclease RecJ [Chloroflexi bacterium]|nr:single-stranded-DNA-specific exonuclease RecJ [Chloroflexota bacterium]